MFAVPKPGRNGKPRPAITSFDPESCAGLAMDHGTGGSQKHYRSFLNKNLRIILDLFSLWLVLSFRLVKVKQSIELVFYNSYKGKGKLR